MSYWEKAVQKILDADPRIRYVGIVDRSYRVIHSQMRQGIRSLTSPETERNFVSMVPPIMVEGADKLESECGSMQGLVIQYKRIVLTIHPVGEYIVVLSFDPSIEMPFLDKLSDLVRSIMK